MLRSSSWESYWQERSKQAFPDDHHHEDGEEFTSASAAVGLSRVVGYRIDLTSEDFLDFRMALRANCFCMAMDDREVLQLAQRAELFSFTEGQEVVTEGEPGTHFFVVKDGNYTLTTQGGVSEDLRLGNSFGEVPLVHGGRQLVTVTAKGKGTCWGIGRDSFRIALTDLARRTHQENLDLLNCVKLFQYLDRVQKVRISKTLVVQIYDKGQSVMEQGAAHTDCMFIVKSGRLEVSVAGQPVATLAPGDFFGERSLLYEAPRSATVSALEPTMVCTVARQLLEVVLGRDFTDVMWRNVIFVSTRNLQLPFDLQTVTNACLIKCFPPGSDVVKDPEEARGLRFIVVLMGEILVRAPDEEEEGRCLPQGECFGVEYLSDGQLPFRHCITTSSDAPCKLALLYADAAATLSAESAEDMMSPEEKMALLRRVFIFRNLSNHHCNLIAKSLRTIVRKQGEQVIAEGETGSQFFVIQMGELLVSRKGRSIRTLGKCDYFGLLYDEPRTATVTCQSQVAWLMVIDKAVFEHIVEAKMLQHLEERIQLQQTDVVLEDLRTVRILGRGTFGVVKLVEHRTRGTQYALKCISRWEATRNQQQDNLRLEREILLENDHPFIVKVVRTFKDERYVYFLTELVAGGELYSAIRVIGILNREQAQFYIGSLILALESLHERCIAYRDLKPENVLLDSQGYTKLIDFGCAAKLKDASHTIVGTPHYIAPEVILGNGYRFSCDVWSLGVCLYEFMCGPLPFANSKDNPIQVFREILSAKLRFPETCTDSSSLQLMRRLLRRQLETRIGCGKSGWKAVRRHGFFRGFSFDRLLSRDLEPPLVPQEPPISEQGEGDAEEEGEEDEEAEVEGEEASARSRSDSESAFSSIASAVPERTPLPIEEEGWDKDF